MDKRGTIVAMIVAVTLIVLWTPITNWIGHRAGWDLTTPITTSNEDNKNLTPSTVPTSQQAGTIGATTVGSAGGLSVAPSTQPVNAITLGSNEASGGYRMFVRTTPVGAGLESIMLNEFKKQIKSELNFTFQQPYEGSEDISRSLATRSITIDGVTTDLSSAPWVVESASQQSVTYSVTINGGSGPLVKINKTLQLDPASDKSDTSQGYEITITHAIVNLSGQPHTFSLQYNGTVDPPREQDRGGERQTLAGYSTRGAIEVVHDAIESYSTSSPAKEYLKDKQGNPVVWAGTMSSYFQALVRPLPLGEDNKNVVGPANYLKDVTASAIGLTPEQKSEDRQISFTFTTVPLQLQQGKTITLDAKAFFGPRQRKLLNSDYYVAYPIDYAASLVLTSGPCGICTFQWLVDLLVNLLRAFHFVARDWGLAIILLVCLVRTILHPITKRSQISMSRMSKMGPEMAKVRERFKDDKTAQQQAMWEIQKQQGVGPYLGCAPMFLQMPIWIALWQALYTTFELRQAPFLWGFTWIHDLSKPDHLLTWSPIPLMFGFNLSAFNLLPILMGVVMYFQMKLQPKPAAATPEQEQQQKMMQVISPLLFPVMLYNGPSGLNLYIMTSTFIGIIESKIVRDHIKQRDEAEKAGVVIVDAGKKFGGKPGTVSRVQTTPTEKPSGVMGWLQQLQERAEQLRRDADKRK